MELQKTALSTCERVFSETREHGLECEIVLPDYYPEIEKILGCSLTPTAESVTLGGDALSVAGCAGIRLTYRAATPGAVSFDTVIKYSKRITCPQTQEGDLCLARQSAVSVQAKAVGPRRIEVRGVIAVCGELYRRAEIEVVSQASAPGLQTACEEESFLQLQGLSVAEMAFRNTVGVPLPRVEISAVLNGGCGLTVQEIRAVTNKVMLKGTLHLTLTLVSAAGERWTDLRYDLPFTEIREAYGLREDAAVSVCILERSFTADPKTEVGERELEITSKFSVLVLGGNQRQVSRLYDAFSCEGEVAVEGGRYPAPLRAEPYAESISFTCSAQPETADAVFVCADATSSAVTVREENGAPVLSLRANLTFYFADRDGRISAVTRTVSAERMAEGITANASPFLWAEVRELRNDASGAGGVFRVEGFWLVPSDREFVTKLELSPRPRGSETLVLYYAAAGERLWEIAKTYRTPPEEIRGADCGPLERLGDDRLLTFYARN